MIVRVVNFVVIGALVLAAAWVYRIKFDATMQAEHLAKLRGEVRHEQDEIATLRAEWSKLDDPAHIQTLAKRFLPLKPIAPTQFDSLDHLPDRPAPDVTASTDPIGGMIQNFEGPETSGITGSIPAMPAAPTDAPSSSVPPQAEAPRQ